MSTHDMKERAFSEPPSQATKIEMADKKQKRKTSAARIRTRVNIGSAFQRWRELKERKACDRTARLLCLFLIGKNVVV